MKLSELRRKLQKASDPPVDTEAADPKPAPASGPAGLAKWWYRNLPPMHTPSRSGVGVHWHATDLGAGAGKSDLVDSLLRSLSYTCSKCGEAYTPVLDPSKPKYVPSSCAKCDTY